MIFRNSARIVALCEAHDEHGGIALHQQIASDHSMLGMVVHAEISAPSLTGTFIELFGHYQKKETNNNFWLLHGAIFGLAHGQVTSGEIVDPTSGMRTTKPTDVKPNMSAAVKPRPAPLASTQDAPNSSICEIDGKLEIQHAELLQPNPGADTHDVKRLGLAVLVYFTFLLSHGRTAILRPVKNGRTLSQIA